LRAEFSRKNPLLEDEGAVMIFEVSDGEEGIIGYFWSERGLFSCLIDSVVFREVDVARDPDESDLAVN